MAVLEELEELEERCYGSSSNPQLFIVAAFGRRRGISSEGLGGRDSMYMCGIRTAGYAVIRSDSKPEWLDTFRHQLQHLRHLSRPRIAAYFNTRPTVYAVPALEPQPIVTPSRSSLAAARRRFSCASLADCCWPCAALTVCHVRRIEEAPSSRPASN